MNFYKEWQSFLGSREKRQRKISIYFCIGFLLSSSLALLAVGLTHIFWNFCDEKVVEKTEFCEKKIVGFFRLVDHGELSIVQLSKLTHVIFSSLLYSGGSIYFGSDKERINFDMMNQKAEPFKVKTMFNLNIRDLGAFSDSSQRRILSNSISTFIERHHLDGINLEWTNPKTSDESEILLKICKSIREELSKDSRRPKIISMTCPKTRNLMDFESALQYLDFLNIEVDNYYSSWDPVSNNLVGPPSPLFSGHATTSNRNVDNTMRYYSCSTSRPNQLVMVFTFSGRYWKNVRLPKDPNDTLWMVSEFVNGGIHGGWESWRDLEKKGWQISNSSWNSESKTPYIWNPETRVYQTFENERSLKEKIRYAIDKNIGGVGVWSICQDDDENTLLNVLSSGELCSGENNKKVHYKCD